MARRVYRQPASARDRIWQSMRVLRRFTHAELAATAETSDRNVQTFLWRLQRAGYVRRVQQGHGGELPRAALYTLARDTGPKSPLPKRLPGKGVRDRNTEELFAEAPVANEEADHV